MYQKIIKLLQDVAANYEEFSHEPILDYETARKVGKKYNWKGIESKSLMLKDKTGRAYVFLTVEGKRFDAKAGKDLTGQKLSVYSRQDLIEKFDCIPGCVAPFGYDQEVSLIVDQEIFQYEDFIFSPGIPEKTIITNVQDIDKILKRVDNKIYFY